MAQNNMLFDEIKSLHQIIRTIKGEVPVKHKDTQTQHRKSSKNKYTQMSPEALGRVAHKDGYS